MNHTIVLGVGPGELENPKHYLIPNSLINRIFARAEVQSAIRQGCASNTFPDIERLARLGVDNIEFYGVWEDKCVIASVYHALELGMNAKVPKGFTMPYPSEGGSLIDSAKRYESKSKFKIRIIEDDEYTYFSVRNKFLWIF